MIQLLNQKDPHTARCIVNVQRPAYEREAEIIQFQGIPQLNETAFDVMDSCETFIGWFEGEELAGIASFIHKAEKLTICRLAVHPVHFRKGIAMALLRYMLIEKEAESFEVTTGAGNEPAKALYQKLGFSEIEQYEPEKGIVLSRLTLHTPRKVKVVSYQKEWKGEFFKEKKQLEALFQNEVLHIHHIGSTSIPGMSAKPIIDILIEVKDLGSAAGFEKGMKMLGYESKGENGIPGRRFFQKGGRNRTHHVHLYESGHPDIRRHLAFRDYLISHPERAEEYATLKMKLAEMFPLDMAGYVEGKNGWIKEAERLAEQWEKAGEDR
ncbi:bifunctional GNAT family N-acetyltransferase/GrpB family protein [Bacillus haynesii]|uniref:bifunctional GNAT family N-acetyltransferase/GrpB family protein n=1 Tax=Bacillus haynesii TaxID=1925021 RepID=UPI002DBAA8EC|nr:bifunctional GNAT family N-acetyltransferase/GrpB family protein [Bacillus haynesii]MEC1507498.1 bifunctional GNAT family N-acetyltransferase/GrpB family protein [Bacillus haynesii]